MNPELQTHGSQRSIEIDWPSDTDSSILHDPQTYDLDYLQEAVPQNNDDLSTLLGLDTCDSDSTAKTLQQSSCSETQFTAEETQTRLIGATQPTTGVLPPTANADESTPHPIHSTPELAIQKASETNTKGGDDQPKPEVKSMQELEAQLRFLRHKLQKGFLPIAGQPKADEMKTMSAYLKKLEHIGDPPQSILRATRITKLLKKITNLDEIPRNGKYSFKDRATALLEKWGTSLEKEDQTTSSTGRPIKHDGTGLSAIADEQKPANRADSQNLLGNEAPTSATGLMEKRALNMVVRSERSASDHNNESIGTPANEHSKPTPPPSPAPHDSREPNRAVIDLTDDDEVDVATGLEPPCHPTDPQSLRPSVARSTQASRSPPPSSTNSEPISTTTRKIQASPKSASAKSDTKKRKRSKATNDERALVSASNSSGNHNMDNTPNRQRPQRKTSPGKHLTNEILWMSGSVSKIEKMIKETEEEIDTIREKRVRLLKENEAEMQAARRRMNESINLKEYLLAWGAQDERVTEEWSSPK
ncbi:hypothetical protein BKA64DRAFT_765897 [Cadophora sp. MPI-SDFR-AT-0126]|nr:hypothetical protein BKA64DRAFT_765897 [Leotiomycetes sp. MPI-SDFR-AT-0126]